MNESILTKRPGITLGEHKPMNSQAVFPVLPKSWKAHVGGMWKGYKMFGAKTAQLAKPGELNLRNDGTLELKTRYDPPNSLLFAFIAAFVSYIIFGVMLFKFGFAGFIGWMPWYVIITLIRRRDRTINLQTADNFMVDTAQRRIGFLTDYEGKKEWIAFEVTENFEEAVHHLKMIKPSDIKEGRVDRSVRPVAILGIIALVMLGLMLVTIIALLSSAGSGKRMRMQNHDNNQTRQLQIERFEQS